MPAAELRDTKVCHVEHECHFYAHSKMKQKEHAETAGLRSDREHTKVRHEAVAGGGGGACHVAASVRMIGPSSGDVLHESASPWVGHELTHLVRR